MTRICCTCRQLFESFRLKQCPSCRLPKTASRWKAGQRDPYVWAPRGTPYLRPESAAEIERRYQAALAEQKARRRSEIAMGW